MSSEELPETKSESITSAAADFGSTFAKVLELEYTELAAQLSATASESELRRTMAAAVYRTFIDSGMKMDDIAQLLNDVAANLFPGPTNRAWSAADNSRRIKLIDKSLQQLITPAESLELAQLTAKMRAVADTEQMVPLEGARRLHRLLTGAEDIPF